MPFSDSLRKVSIKQGTLSAECRKADQKTWISSTINLDEFLGNVDGKFVLGAKGFSASAQDITLADGVISAKLKNHANKFVDAKFDLSNYISSKDGILAAHGQAGGAVQTTRPALEAIHSSAMSSEAVASMMSSAMSSSTSSSHFESHSSSHSAKSFRSSSFRQFSQQLLLEEVCFNFVLKGSFLHCDVRHEDGSVTHASFDLNVCIGNVENRLVWDAAKFTESCKDIHLDGLWLVAKVRDHHHHDQYVSARLDLRTRLRLQGGVIIFVETNKKLSMMLSEVPWMKFKVIAEPDLSVFKSHPVVQQTMTRIAESTVEHVTMEMHRMMTIAMESAIVAITASAMKHISTQMEHTVQDAVGYAVASPSATESEFLHIGAAGAYFGGGGFAHGHGHAHGHAHGGQIHGYGGGFYNGGAGAGAAYGNGFSAGSIHAGSLSRSVSESSSISTSSSHSESSAASISTATHQASKEAAAVTAAAQATRV